MIDNDEPAALNSRIIAVLNQQKQQQNIKAAMVLVTC